MDDDGDEFGPHTLAAELGKRSGALETLVALHDRGGTATLVQLQQGRRRRSSRTTTEALRWLASVGLVERAEGAGTWDLNDRTTPYRLSEVGHPLAASWTALTVQAAGQEKTRRSARASRWRRLV